MAKSQRSKWKRKMRATIRNKNEARVLKKLKDTLNNNKITMTDDMVKLQEKNLLFQQKKDEENLKQIEKASDSNAMEIENTRNKRTLLDKNGQYPVWVNSRMAGKLRAKRKAKKSGGVRKSGRTKKLAW